MIKTCLLCLTPISLKHVLCYPCFREYRNHMHEPWFLALIELQKIQDRIDTRERYTIDNRTNTNLYGNVVETPARITKKAIGRPLTDWRIVNKILELFDNSVESERFSNGKRLSLRAISRLLDHKVGFVTVRRVLMDYRRDVFLEKGRNST